MINLDSRSVRLMIEARREQIERFGHTPEADLRCTPAFLPKQAQRYLTHAIEDLHFDPAGPEGRKRAIRHLAQSAALIMAAIDRLDAEDMPAPITATAEGDPL